MHTDVGPHRFNHIRSTRFIETIQKLWEHLRETLGEWMHLPLRETYDPFPGTLQVTLDDCVFM